MSETTLDANGFAETDGTITVHNYSQLNGEYTGSSDAFLAKGVGIPACSTMIAPPGAKAGYAQVFSASGKAWSYSEDHRGQIVYNKETGQPFTITGLGPIDETIYSLDQPPAAVVPLKDQAASENANWIQSQINEASVMGETFSDAMKAYVKEVRAIASGADTTSTALPARPSDIMS